MKTIKSILSVVMFLTSIVVVNAQSVEFKWSVAGLENPESVYHDSKTNLLYVSNVNGAPTDKDGNGYISILSTTGNIISQKWIEGLNAPKGMGVFGGKLYIADIDRVVVVDMKTGKVISTFDAPGATFLNDIVIDSKGVVYISNTFGFSGIYKLVDNKVSLWLKNEALNLPNGLAIDQTNLYVASWGANPNPNTYATETPGKIIKVTLSNNVIGDMTSPVGNLDGLVCTADGKFITDWLSGKLLYYASSTKTLTEILDLPQGSADIGFNYKTNVLYIPQMLDNKVVAYSVK